MKKREEYDEALAAEYALGTLRGPARQRFQRRLTQHPDLTKRVARWQNVLGHLDNALPPITPPPEIWQKIERDLPPQPLARKPFRWHYLGWALAASFAGALLFNISQSPPEQQAVAVLNASNAQQGSWVAALDRNKGELSLTAVNTISLPADRSLQLWLIPQGEKPQSLGLVQAGSVTRVKLAVDRLSAAPLLAISLEPKGGSSTGQPTGPVVFSGQVAEI
ncbi:anti-sigma factor domain-containing protein [Kalamiella sp. sgz302252]|uniref:anti-sigma factor n=1 Tax=Pantoea sp. sgz302252 TaxID=3341827 RepID=UPI0036D2A1E3